MKNEYVLERDALGINVLERDFIVRDVSGKKYLQY